MKTELNLYKYNNLRLFLAHELVDRCKRRPSYSLRAFARHLQMDPTALSKILRGNRPIRSNLTKKLCGTLNMDPRQTAHFIQKTEFNRNLDQNPTLQLDQLTLDQFQVIKDWYHYAILELMECDGFVNNSRWIATRLGITTTEVNEAFIRLQRVGILKKTAEGWVEEGSGTSTTVGNDFTAVAFKTLQEQILQKAITALYDEPLEERDQSSLTLAIDTSQVTEAKDFIKKFRRSFLEKFGSPPKKNRVYNLCLSLYPASKLIKKPSTRRKK